MKTAGLHVITSKMSPLLQFCPLFLSHYTWITDTHAHSLSPSPPPFSHTHTLPVCNEWCDSTVVMFDIAVQWLRHWAHQTAVTFSHVCTEGCTEWSTHVWCQTDICKCLNHPRHVFLKWKSVKYILIREVKQDFFNACFTAVTLYSLNRTCATVFAH